MLKLVSNGGAVINTDDFYIVQKASGIDELIFNISVHDENYPKIIEEAVVEYEQPYLVKAIDAGMQMAKVKCQLNLDELKADMNPNYSNNNAALYETISGVLPSGWTFFDHSFSEAEQTIEGGYTAFDIIMECMDAYKVVFRFDVKRKRISSYHLDNFESIGAFASGDLNLREINYKGKSTSFYTRLYAYGKKGLSFEDINNGKPYVENFQYSDKVVCAYWQDDRYEEKKDLLDDAKERLKTASIPERSYECTVVDLAKTNPDMYSFQDFSLFSVIRLIDEIKDISIDYQVVEYCEYPFYPEKNVVTLSSTAPKIQESVKDIKNEITNPNSGFWSIMNNAISSATDWITGVNGGYVIFHKDENDVPYEILVMDTPDIATSKNVWRWNQNGFGHSSKGYNGPYDLAMTIDGAIVANFITAGTMLADRIKGGTLQLGGKGNGNGVLQIVGADGKQIGKWDKDGIEITKGSLSGTSITLGGENDRNGKARVLDADGNEIVRLDQSGVYAKGRYVCVSKDGTKQIYLSNGKLDFWESGGFSFHVRTDNINEKGRMMFYPEQGSSISTYLTLDETSMRSQFENITLHARSKMSLICKSLTIQDENKGYQTKSGRAEFSDGTYLDFKHGILIGGNTKEGAF